MSTTLKTKSHGEIDTGFQSVFTDFVKFGDYFFLSRDFCNAVKEIAQSPTVHKFELSGFPISEFDTEVANAIQRMLGKSIASSMRKKEGEVRVEVGREVTEFDDKNPNGKKRKIHSPNSFKQLNILISTSEKNDEIKIGKYVVKSSEFAYLCYGIAIGGFAGWPEPVPKFASELEQALKSTSSEVFKVLNRQKVKR